jgi:hypothetical protein
VMSSRRLSCSSEVSTSSSRPGYWSSMATAAQQWACRRSLRQNGVGWPLRAVESVAVRKSKGNIPARYSGTLFRQTVPGSRFASNIASLPGGIARARYSGTLFRNAIPPLFRQAAAV